MLSTRFGFGTLQLVNVRHRTQQGSRDHAKSRTNVESPVNYEPESIKKGDISWEGTHNPFLDALGSSNFLQMDMSSWTSSAHTPTLVIFRLDTPSVHL